MLLEKVMCTLSIEIELLGGKWLREGRFNIPSLKLSEESINKMIEDYESGMSNLQIKVKYGISIMTMYKYFSERGVIWKKGKR